MRECADGDGRGQRDGGLKCAGDRARDAIRTSLERVELLVDLAKARVEAVVAAGKAKCDLTHSRFPLEPCLRLARFSASKTNSGSGGFQTKSLNRGIR